MVKLASPIRGGLIRTGKYGKRGQVDVGGLKSGVNHEGIDVRAAVGTPVYPTIGGTVVQTITGWTSEASVGVSRGRRIFSPGMTGNTVVIRGDDGRDHVYAHNSSVSTVVGRRVETDTMIARSGKSGGNRMAAHLHYGIWLEYAPNRWRSIDPTPLLPLTGDKFGQLDIKTKTPLEEDDMYDAAAKATADATLEALGNLAGRVWTIQERQIPDVLAKLDQLIAAVNRTETNAAINKWALTDGTAGVRKVLADLSNAVKVMPGAGALGEVTLDDAALQRIADAVNDEQDQRERDRLAKTDA